MGARGSGVAQPAHEQDTIQSVLSAAHPVIKIFSDFTIITIQRYIRLFKKENVMMWTTRKAWNNGGRAIYCAFRYTHCALADCHSHPLPHLKNIFFLLINTDNFSFGVLNPDFFYAFYPVSPLPVHFLTIFSPHLIVLCIINTLEGGNRVCVGPREL